MKKPDSFTLVMLVLLLLCAGVLGFEGLRRLQRAPQPAATQAAPASTPAPAAPAATPAEPAPAPAPSGSGGIQ